MSNFCARSLSRARGTISLSVKSRAVSAISRCSSLSSRSTLRAPAVARQPVGDHLVECGTSLLGARPVAVELPAVHGADRLHLAYRGGEERLAGLEQVIEREVALLDVV